MKKAPFFHRHLRRRQNFCPGNPKMALGWTTKEEANGAGAGPISPIMSVPGGTPKIFGVLCPPTIDVLWRFYLQSFKKFQNLEFYLLQFFSKNLQEILKNILKFFELYQNRKIWYMKNAALKSSSLNCFIKLSCYKIIRHRFLHFLIKYSEVIWLLLFGYKIKNTVQRSTPTEGEKFSRFSLANAIFTK